MRPVFDSRMMHYSYLFVFLFFGSPLLRRRIIFYSKNLIRPTIKRSVNDCCLTVITAAGGPINNFAETDQRRTALAERPDAYDILIGMVRLGPSLHIRGQDSPLSKIKTSIKPGTATLSTVFLVKGTVVQGTDTPFILETIHLTPDSPPPPSAPGYYGVGHCPGVFFLPIYIGKRAVVMFFSLYILRLCSRTKPVP